MVNGENVQSIMDMGIPEDVAIDALRRVNGDLEAAVNYIFSNELPNTNMDDGTIAETQLESEHVNINNDANFKVGDLSGVINRSNYDSNGYESDSNDDSSDDSNTPGVIENDVFNNSKLPSYNIVKHEIEKNSLADPTVVMPLPHNSMIESYFGLFSMFISIYLPHLVLKPDFKDLTYDKDWYKGVKLDIPIYGIKLIQNDSFQKDAKSSIELISEIDGNLDDQPRLLWQLQKLTTIMNNPMSERSYVCSKLFSLCLDRNARLRLQDAEHLHDVLPYFIKYLTTNLELCPGLEPEEIRNSLISSASYVPSDDEPVVKTLLTLFHFLPDEYESNLYKMFNVLLYPDEDDDDSIEEGNSLNYLASNLTIIFDEIDESSSMTPLPEGVAIPLEFYPQLYTKNCKEQLIKHIIGKRKDAQVSSREILKDINNLKSFQGKDILKFVNSTLDYLEKDKIDVSNVLIDGLTNIKKQLATKKTQKMNAYKELTQKLNSLWNLSNPESNIIPTAKQLGLIDEPYYLSMAVMSPYLYYIKKRDGTWYLVQNTPNGDDFDIRKCSSGLEIQDCIKQYTRHGSEYPLMFMYTKGDTVPDEETVQQLLEENVGCSKFLKEDQINLAQPTNESEEL